MNSLYIDRKNLSLQHQKDALLVFDGEHRCATIPLRLLERIIIASQVQISANTLGKLGSMGIGVMVLCGYQREVTLLMPAHSDAERRLQQYQHCQTHSLLYAKQLLHEKLHSQQQLLMDFQLYEATYWQHAHQQIEHAQNLSQLLGIEGHAAHYYFSQWPTLIPAPWTFTGRHKRPPTDAINALLSLGYTLLYAEAVRTLYAAGLDVAKGFYHQANNRRHALACDVMEPVRAVIDGWVLNSVLNHTWHTQHFNTQEQACLLLKEGRQLFYSEYERHAQEWRLALQQHVQQWCQRWQIPLTERPAQWSEWEAVCSKSPTV